MEFDWIYELVKSNFDVFRGSFDRDDFTKEQDA